MKKAHLIAQYFLPVFMAICGCSGFLEESSQDEVRPATTEDLNQIMLGEAYPLAAHFENYLDLLTDDVQSSLPSDGQTDRLLAYLSVFTWQDDLYEQMAMRNVTTCDTWEKYYRHIMGCNVVLDMVGKVSGQPSEKENLRGQALAMRAYYYFMLVNLYAKPYNAEGINLDEEPGVPLMLASPLDDKYPPRASMAAVYKLIEDNLLEAFPLIEQYGQNNNKYRVTNLFIGALLCRLYLYQEKWDSALQYADYVLEQRPALLNMSAVNRISGDPVVKVYDVNSPELIWAYSTVDEYNNVYGNSIKAPPYFASQELYCYLYEAAPGTTPGVINKSDPVMDYRQEYYYNRYFINMVQGTLGAYHGGDKSIRQSNTANACKGFRTAELYLNRAECYIRKYMVNPQDEYRNAALADLNFLRENRYNTTLFGYTPKVAADFATAAELLQFYKDERRRELCFEGHRWFDLRRYGMPKLEHRVQRVAGGGDEIYTLPEKSARYTLPIARKVMDANPALVQNPKRE
jgi:hypothetical protein